MPTPYERTAEPSAGGAAAPPAARPPLTRPTQGRVIAGVCEGIARHLGLPSRTVRIVMVILTIGGGAGLVAYVFLWALTPQSDQPTTWGSQAGAETAERTGAQVAVIGGLLFLGGLAWVLQANGFNLRLGLLVPLLVVAVGAIIAWSQLDEVQRDRWLGSDVTTKGYGLARLAFGVVLAVIGMVVLATRGRSLSTVWDSLLAVLAVLAGAVLIAAPWGLRLWTELRREQEAAARATERADIAAHLHDSVLQTLALIQRKADDATSVQQLARAQERELRSWLYAGPAGSQASLAAAATEVTHEVEDLHGIPVDLVVTGDQPLDARGEALVRAMREALLNAVRHGSPPVSAYLEVGAAGVEAYVRDHGDGFDVAQIPQDRLGVRESLVGRMQRHQGTARVRRLDSGTEIELRLPSPAGTEGEEP